MAKFFFATTALRTAVAVRCSETGERRATICRSVGYLHQSQLSDLLSGARPARQDDARVLRLCALLSLPFEKAFEAAGDESRKADGVAHV